MSTPSRSQLKRAENEATFQQHNEQLKDQARDIIPSTTLTTFELSFVSERADENCQGRLHASIPEYERIHQHQRWFMVCPGHVEPDIESVIETRPDYVVLEKFDTPPISQGRLHSTDADHAE